MSANVLKVSVLTITKTQDRLQKESNRDLNNQVPVSFEYPSLTKRGKGRFSDVIPACRESGINVGTRRCLAHF
jgi:hypothetical protein